MGRGTVQYLWLCGDGFQHIRSQLGPLSWVKVLNIFIRHLLEHVFRAGDIVRFYSRGRTFVLKVPYGLHGLPGVVSGDLDEKTKAMLTVIQEDGDSFAQRAEMYYRKRPELIRMVEEFHRSYRSLAEKYDQLRSESNHVAQSRSSSSSNSFKQVQHLHNSTKRLNGSSSDSNSKLEAPDSHPESVVEDPAIECDASNFDFESLNKLTDELMSIGPNKLNSKLKFEVGDSQKDGNIAVATDTLGVNKKMNGFESGRYIVRDLPMGGSLDRESMWSQPTVQVSKLMEDNMRLQAELIRRNDEKREVIKDLSFKLYRQMDQNRAQQSCLRCSKAGVKQNQSQISKLKGMILGKFLGP
ncbi:hypothetical protein HHK36_025257 [Tetracentron sinense]|uniref:NAB domain-containing protein n=1 Tax=Tetracentron sinense TaxID=13715 RepID=A0A834YMP8_TETSI|nr:hypothetical protein HHK36_025257 [Tetracentron sinense]